MPFTVAELENIANAALDFYITGPAKAQTIQTKPLLDKMLSKQKTFPGGKEFISTPVKGEYTTAIMGYSHDDTVSYSNPANIKRVVFPWRELHAGISMTMTELKNDGVSVVDSLNGAKTSDHSQVEKTRLTSILQDKLDDLMEGWARSFNEMLWQDGTQDAKAIPGIQSIISGTPTTGTMGGLNRGLTTWWRNRTSLAINAATPANQVLVNTLQTEFRQLRRYGGKPDCFLCGSSFLEALEKEYRALGNYSETGFAGGSDLSVGDLKFKKLDVVYDPTLDDLGLAKYAYVLDSRHIYLDAMDGEDRKTHNPARPADKYVLYRAITYTGGMVCDQANSHGVYSIA